MKYVYVNQCFVLVMEYIPESGAPECIFHIHKTLYNICIGYSMFCVGYGIYTRELSSRVYISLQTQNIV